MSFTFVAACWVFIFGLFLNGAGGSRVKPQNFWSFTCPYAPSISCPTNPPFRPIDGSCNVASSPYLGKSETPYIRIAPPVYKGLNTPKNTSYMGGPLPGPRKISIELFKSTSVLSKVFSAIAPYFARFVEHDLYKTKLLDASSCCTPNQGAGVCDNIKVSNTDPFFKIYLKTCLPKGNVVESTKIDCKTGGFAQQINMNTHPMDLSNIYGSTKAASDRLRTKIDGLLKMSPAKDLLPPYALTECLLPVPNTNNEHCFDAGDLRVNIDPMIMTMYTVWARHHNAIAKQLKPITKDATDEKLFQLARKIVISQYQHITYNELLLAMDGTSTLKTPTSGTSSYNATLKPTVLNTFSLMYTALVDSSVPPTITVGSAAMKLENVFYKPTMLFETDSMKKMLESMMGSKAETIDRFMTQPLTNNYKQKIPGSGTDKVALNLQQSRENGAPRYVILNGILNRVFDFTLPEIDNIKELKALYSHHYDIELLPGLFSEKKIGGAMYGKTMKKLMDLQFYVLKYGDPYFYTHDNVFTPEEYAEIKKTTLAGIFCKNGPLTDVLPKALQLETAPGNAKVTCATITDMDICAWSTIEWSKWEDMGCFFGVKTLIRQCMILAGSTCKCTGEPIDFQDCPFGPFQPFLAENMRQKINTTFYENFDHDGKPLDPKHPDFRVILENMKG